MGRISISTLFLLLTACALFEFTLSERTDGWSDRSLQTEWSDDAQVEEKKRGGEEMLQALMAAGGSEDCFGRKCLSADQCCKGSVCVDVKRAKAGTCFPIYEGTEGAPCEAEEDCATGLTCSDAVGADTSARVCQPEGRELKKKQYNDECVTSDECDAEKGLCCQILRRHRMAPRRLCYYFVDPNSCLGKTSTSLKPINFMPNAFFKARLG